MASLLVPIYNILQFTDVIQGTIMALLTILLLQVTSIYSHQFLTESQESIGLGFLHLPPSEIIGIEGGIIMIPCGPFNCTSPHIGECVIWTHKNVPIISNKQRLLSENGTLIIYQVQPEDTGAYRCIVTSYTEAVVSPVVNLILAGTRAWQITPRNTTTIVGSATRFTCHVSSIPPADISWLHNGVHIGVNNRFHEPNPGVLQINNLQPDDAGPYSCTATNPLLISQTLSTSGYLILEQLTPTNITRPPRKPTLLPAPSNVVVVVGDSAVLECMYDHPTSSVLASEIQWSRIDRNAIRTIGVSRKGEGSLVLDNVVSSDSGVYNCSVISPLFNLPVTQMTELKILSPPFIVQSPVSSEVYNGRLARFNCTASGDPTPIINWYKDGRPITSNGRYCFSPSDQSDRHRINFRSDYFYITSTMKSDRGIFQCVASNRVGVASEAARLTVLFHKNNPNPPTNISVVRITPKSLSFTWKPPQETIDGYLVDLLLTKRSDNGEDFEHHSKQEVIENVTFVEFINLQPYTNYSMYVRSILIDNAQPLFSSESDTIYIRTQSMRPRNNPVVVLKPLGPSTLLVTWPHKVMLPEGPVVTQQLEWKRKYDHYHDQMVVQLSETSQVIANLRPRKLYEVRVLVATDAGFSPQETSESWKTIRMPSEKSKGPILHLTVNDSTSIKAFWSVSKKIRTTMNSFLLSYNSSTLQSQQIKLPPESNSYTISNLDPSTCLSVVVRIHFDGNKEESDVTNELIGTSGYDSAACHHICTLNDQAQPHRIPNTTNRQDYPNPKLFTKKVKVNILNSTTIKMNWRTGQRKEAQYYIIRLVVLATQSNNSKIEDMGIHPAHSSTDSLEPVTPGITSLNNFFNEELQQKHSMQSDVIKDESSLQLSDIPTDKPREASSDYTPEVTSSNPRYILVTQHRVILSHLQPTTSYVIQIASATWNDTGNYSQTVRITLPEGVPSVVENVIWNTLTTSEINITWSPPKYLNGNLSHYWISYSHDSAMWHELSVPNYVTTVKLNSLISNKNYTVKLAGVTGGGAGEQIIIYVYIHAYLNLNGDSYALAPESIVMYVVGVLVVMTSVIMMIICYKMLRFRRRSEGGGGGGQSMGSLDYEEGTPSSCGEEPFYAPEGVAAPPEFERSLVHFDPKYSECDYVLMYACRELT